MLNPIWIQFQKSLLWISGARSKSPLPEADLRWLQHLAGWVPTGSPGWQLGVWWLDRKLWGASTAKKHKSRDLPLRQALAHSQSTFLTSEFLLSMLYMAQTKIALQPAQWAPSRCVIRRNHLSLLKPHIYMQSFLYIAQSWRWCT